MKHHLLSDPAITDGVVADTLKWRAHHSASGVEELLMYMLTLYTNEPRRQAVVQRWQRHLERAERTDWVAVVTDQQSGQEIARYKLKRHDTTDERHWADVCAESCGMEIDDSDGYIPNCSGDICVTVYRHPDDVGGVSCWSSECFYFKRED